MGKETKRKMASESRNTLRISNLDLTCANCLFVFDDAVKAGNTSSCMQYKDKPNSILMGGECPKKKEKKISI